MTSSTRGDYLTALDFHRQASALGATCERAYQRAAEPWQPARKRKARRELGRRLGILADDEGAHGAAVARDAEIMAAFVVASADMILRRGVVRYQARALDFIARAVRECGFPDPVITLENPGEWTGERRELGFKESADLDPAQYARFRSHVLGADPEDDGGATLGTLTYGGLLPARSYHWEEGWGDGAYDPTSDLIADAYVSEYLPPFVALANGAPR